MDCPKCGGGTRVLETEPYSDRVRRRRTCEDCGHRFTTNEEPRISEETWARMARRHLNEAIDTLMKARAAGGPLGLDQFAEQLDEALGPARRARDRLEQLPKEE